MSQALQLFGETPDLKTEFKFTTDVHEAETSIARAEDVRQYAMYLERKCADLHAERVTVLGQGEAFVRTDENGQLRALKTAVPLRMSEGHIYALEQKSKINNEWVVTGRDWRITAAGYQFINTVAGVQIITPPRIEVEGKSVPNPYVLRHEDERRRSALREVHVRTIAFGRAATGNLVMADSYLIWRPISYLTTSIVAMVDRKVYEGSGKNRSSRPIDDVAMMLESEFIEGRQSGALRGWAFWPIEEAGDDMVGVAAAVTNPEVAKQIKAHSERQKFADRIARTIAERIALKKLIGAAKVQAREQWHNGTLVDAVAMVPVFAWAEPDSLLFKDGGVRRLLERAKTAEEPMEVNALMEAARSAAVSEGRDLQIVQSRVVSGDDEDDFDPTIDEREAAEHREMTDDMVSEAPRRRGASDDAGPLFAGEEG